MSAVITTALIVFAWSLLPVVTGRMPGFLAVMAWNIVGVAIGSGGLRRVLLDGFSNDGLFNLALSERVVVVGIAAVLMLGSAWLALTLAYAISRKPVGVVARCLGLIGNLAIVAGGYVGIVFLSPQLFYTYYRVIMPTLPDQWVIGGVGHVERIADTLWFPVDSTLAMTMSGLGFWVVMASTVTVHVCATRTNKPPSCDV